MAEPTFSVEMTLPEMRSAAKSLSISLDVTARKLERIDPNSKFGRELRDDYKLQSDALATVRDALDQALGLL